MALLKRAQIRRRPLLLCKHAAQSSCRQLRRFQIPSFIILFFSLPGTSKINARRREQTAGGGGRGEPDEGDNFLEFSTRFTLLLTSVRWGEEGLHSERTRISLSLSRLRYSCIRSPTINNSFCHRCGVPPLSRKTNYFSLGWRRRIAGWLAH